MLIIVWENFFKNIWRKWREISVVCFRFEMIFINGWKWIGFFFCGLIKRICKEYVYNCYENNWWYRRIVLVI